MGSLWLMVEREVIYVPGSNERSVGAYHPNKTKGRMFQQIEAISKKSTGPTVGPRCLSSRNKPQRLQNEKNLLLPNQSTDSNHQGFIDVTRRATFWASASSPQRGLEGLGHGTVHDDDLGGIALLK